MVAGALGSPDKTPPSKTEVTTETPTATTVATTGSSADSAVTDFAVAGKTRLIRRAGSRPLFVCVARWTGRPTRVSYTWLRSQHPIRGSHASTYRLRPADSGKRISCVARVTRGGHTVAAGSVPRRLWTAPIAVTAPRVAGSPRIGVTLFCSSVRWKGAPTRRTITWLRDGQAFATGRTHRVTASDAGRSLRCVETAQNPAGRAVRRSASTRVARPKPVALPQPVAPAVTPGGGATAQCSDGTYSYSQHHQGTCSHHGGVAVWYK